jgi:hypothetical protein
MPNWTDAYCIKILSVVYLKIPTRKTGNINRMFVLDSALRMPSAKGDFAKVHGPLGPSSFIGFGESTLRIRRSGMNRSSIKHSTSEPKAKPHGIYKMGQRTLDMGSITESPLSIENKTLTQGEMSIVTEAMNDPRSSAT